MANNHESIEQMLRQINQRVTMLQRGLWKPFTLTRREGAHTIIALITIDQNGNVINEDGKTASFCDVKNVRCDVCHRLPSAITVIRCPYCLTDTKACELEKEVHCQHCGKLIRTAYDEYL